MCRVSHALLRVHRIGTAKLELRSNLQDSGR
jgi:hypothetical protein